MCHRKQLYALEKIGRNTTYSDLHPIEAEAHQNGCTESFQKGPAVYAYCLKEDFKRWKNSTHVKVNLLDEPTRSTLKSRCREEFNSGLPAFSKCLVEHLPSVIAKSSSDKPTPAESNSVNGQTPSPSSIAITPEELFRKVSPSIVYISTIKGADSAGSSKTKSSVTDAESFLGSSSYHPWIYCSLKSNLFDIDFPIPHHSPRHEWGEKSSALPANRLTGVKNFSR